MDVNNLCNIEGWIMDVNILLKKEGWIMDVHRLLKKEGWNMDVNSQIENEIKSATTHAYNDNTQPCVIMNLNK